MSVKTPVFVVGATGLLGSRIARALLDDAQPVRALVRSGVGEEKREALRVLEGHGLEVVEGDITDSAERLASLMHGSATVVSAVQGGPEVIVDGQVNLLRAAEQAGVRRFIPSDFAIDLTKLDDEDNVMIGWRRRAAERFRSSGVDVTSVLNGAFMEVMIGFMQIVDWERGTVSHWGDPDQPLDLTSVDDTAEYAAAVAVDPQLAGRTTLRFAGEVMTMRQFHEAVEAGSGRKLEFRTLGTADELRAEIGRRAAATQDPLEYVGLQYQWCMVTGKAKFDTLDNGRYPEVKPISMEDIVRETILGSS